MGLMDELIASGMFPGNMPEGFQYPQQQAPFAFPQRRAAALPFAMGGALPQGQFPGIQAGPTPEEIAAASQPAMFGQQPRMGGLGPALQRMAGGVQAANPFDRGAKPIMGLDGMSPGGGADEAAGATQPDGETIPLPRFNPKQSDIGGGMDVSSRGANPAGLAGPPMSLAPPAGPAAMPAAMPPGGQMAAPGQENGFLKSISDNTPLLLALAGGFAGAPSIGTGMRRAFSNAAPVAAASQKRKDDQNLLTTQRDQIYKQLRDNNVPEAVARAAAVNPAILKEVADKYFGKGPEPKEPKAPTVQEFSVDGGTQKRQWNPATNKWDDIPGTVVETGDKRKALSVSDLTKLSDEATKYKAIERYATGFKDAYAGDVVDAVGEAKNWSGRSNPFAGKETKDRAAWWQDYSQYRNAVRHDLFGSALTAPEKAAFLESDITPGMQPDMIKRNLARQQEIVTGAMKRKGGALIEGGAPKGQVAKIYGIEPSFFDEKPAAKAAPRTGKTASGVSWKIEDDE